MKALFAAALLCSLPALAERRAALFLGESAGDQFDAPLRYAESDAAAMREVLVRLGGVAPQDAVLLRGATAPELRAALAALGQRLAREGYSKEDRLLLYVSAHAGAGELHLRGSRFPLAELRRFVDESPAGVALLILDTCESGAALRAKGLVPLAGQPVRMERPALTGRVIIASAGAHESAFESDELGGSLFTQHFIAGLRGAADSSRDGSVSLQEAYAYAYARTIDSVAAVREATQTPVFDVELQGEGELVLTEPGRGEARLTLDIERPGEWVVASLDGSAVVARFVKAAGRAVFALDAGSYRLRSRTGDFYAEGVVQVAERGQARITEADLSRWKLVPAGRKGGGAQTSLFAGGALGSAAITGLGVMKGFAVSVRHAPDWTPGGARPLVALELSQLSGRAAVGGLQEQELALSAGLGSLGHIGPVELRALGQAGAVAVWQHDGGIAARVAVQPRAGAQLGAALRVLGAVSVDAAVSAGALLVHTDQDRHLQPFLAAQAGAAVAW